jgi:DNA-binding response OmpR family regulator
MMMAAQPTTILVADEDPPLLRLVARILELEGYRVLTASDGQQTLKQLEIQRPDLLVLALSRSRMDGVMPCQQVRQASQVPIVLLTARWHEQELARALAQGADDYLYLPFRMDDLLTRVQAVLGRAQWKPHDYLFARSQLRVGELTLERDQPLVQLAGRTIVLTPVEYALLASLAQCAGQLVPADALLAQVWGAGYVGEHFLLQATITRLRQKLEPDPARPCYLLTERGRGYRLVDPSS